MIELRKLAETEGEAWARRLMGHLRPGSHPIASRWPGRLEEARLLAQRIEAEPIDLDGLAAWIQAHAEQVWTTLVAHP